MMYLNVYSILYLWVYIVQEIFCDNYCIQNTPNLLNRPHIMRAMYCNYTCIIYLVGTCLYSGYSEIIYTGCSIFMLL